MSKSKEKKDFFAGIETKGSASGSVVLVALEAACKKTGLAVGTNELAEMMAVDGNLVTPTQVRHALQKIRKKGGAEKRARIGSIEINGKTLEWKDVRDPRGVLYAFHD